MTLQELTQYIRETVPQAKAIAHLQIRESMDAVTFGWQGRDFLVKPSMQVLEMKNNNLYITGASMLLQSVLLKRDSNQKVIESILEVLYQVEDLILVKHQTEAGLKLLTNAKATMRRLAGK